MSLIKDYAASIKVVSMSDVVRHPLFAELSKKSLDVTYMKKGKPQFKKIEGLNAMLWTMGLDIFKPFESEVIEHRSELTQEVHTCERFVGQTRQDAGWKKIERQLLLERDFLA